ncbi:MAG TPA: hypothetical protein VKT75_16590 [Acidobacteriaceae bacterium]|nr:hypothetical protein [Acidobacteriaceae bacterium]
MGNLVTDDNGIRIKSDPTCSGLVNQVTSTITPSGTGVTTFPFTINKGRQ